MRLSLFTLKEPIPDVQTTSQERKPNPEVMIKDDDLYVRARESDLESLFCQLSGQTEPT